MPLNSTYKYMGGTSMSNPLAAGAAAVVRDFYKKTHDLDASAALVKATLINSAVDLLDENNDGVNDNDFPIPNVHEGWGRIDVNAATDGSHLFVENTSGLNTNGTATYMIEVASSTQPFRVSLVWTDYPASVAAATALVNNLDLKLTAPNSSLYRGNVFSGGWSQTGGSGDSLNNVENVYVQSPATGVWTVEVSGTSVSNGSQPFALVLDGDFSPLAAPSVAIAIDSNDTTDVVLSWPNNPAIDYYDIWRGQNPYLTAGDADATSTTVATTSDPASYIDDGAAGNPAQNQFYVVHSVSILGQTSNGSSRKGVFTFGLTPGSPIP